MSDLPVPDLVLPTKITDPPGAGHYYSAATMARELERLRKSRTSEHIDMLMAEAERLRVERDALLRERTIDEQRVADLMADLDRTAKERDALREELSSVLSDWNALVKAIGSPTNGGAIGVAVALRADAERYRWLRYASVERGCIPYDDWWEKLGDTIDEDFDATIDAAMRGKEQSND